MNEAAVESIDSMEGRPIRCELEMDGLGIVTLRRGPGCTLVDALDLCVQLVSGGYQVLDVTPRGPAALVEVLRRYSNREDLLKAMINVLRRMEENDQTDEPGLASDRGSEDVPTLSGREPG